MPSWATMISAASARTISPHTTVPTLAGAGPAVSWPAVVGMLLLSISVAFLDRDVAESTVDLHHQVVAGPVGVVAALAGGGAAALASALIQVAHGHVRLDVHRHVLRNHHGHVAGGDVQGNDDVGLQGGGWGQAREVHGSTSGGDVDSTACFLDAGGVPVHLLEPHPAIVQGVVDAPGDQCNHGEEAQDAGSAAAEAR